MTRGQIILALVLAEFVLFIAMMPLGAILPGANGPENGLTARHAEGEIWDGDLRDVRLGGIPLGDAHVALQLVPLLLGEARFETSTTTLKGALVATNGGQSVRRMTGTILTAGRFGPLPIASITLDGVDAGFHNGHCVLASGVVRATVSGDVGGLALPGGLSGTARCDGAALLLPLASQSGLERVDLRLSGDGRWRAQASIKPGDPALAAKLLSSGFAQGATGLSMHFSGSF